MWSKHQTKTNNESSAWKDDTGRDWLPKSRWQSIRPHAADAGPQREGIGFRTDQSLSIRTKACGSKWSEEWQNGNVRTHQGRMPADYRTRQEFEKDFSFAELESASGRSEKLEEQTAWHLVLLRISREKERYFNSCCRSATATRLADGALKLGEQPY